MKKPIYVYTSIIDNYDTPPSLSFVDPDIEYICLTDTPTNWNDAGPWKFIEIKKYFKDGKITNGYVKTNSHNIFGSDCISVWIDANHDNLSISSTWVYEILAKQPVAASPHLSRKSILEEIAAVVSLKLEDPTTAGKHLIAMQSNGYEDNCGLAATPLLIRDHTNPKVRRMNEYWWDCIAKGLRRDQLSFNYAVWLSGLDWERIDIDWRKPNAIYTRRAHKNPNNRTLNIDDSVYDGSLQGFKNSPSSGHYFNEVFYTSEVSEILKINKQHYSEGFRHGKDDCYHTPEVPIQIFTPIDPRLSWVRMALDDATNYCSDVIQFGFTSGYSAAFMLTRSPTLKINIVINEQDVQAAHNALLLKTSFHDRVTITKTNKQFTIEKILTSKAKFDLIHLCPDATTEDLIFSLGWAENTKNAAKILIEDATNPLKSEIINKIKVQKLFERSIRNQNDHSIRMLTTISKTNKEECTHPLTDNIKILFNNLPITYIVQIGANDGKINDPIYDIVLSNKSKNKILLIEPQPDVIKYLLENYKDHDQAYVWNGAIGTENNLTLYRIKPKYHDVFTKRYLINSPSYRVPTGFTSASREHVVKHALGNLPPEISIDEAIEEITIPSSRLQNLIQSQNIPFERVDVLQVDTEGMDDVVLYASDLESLRPFLINFEHQHIPTGRYEKLIQYLESIGYDSFKWSTSDTLAILKKP